MDLSAGKVLREIEHGKCAVRHSGEARIEGRLPGAGLIAEKLLTAEDSEKGRKERREKLSIRVVRALEEYPCRRRRCST